MGAGASFLGCGGARATKAKDPVAEVETQNAEPTPQLTKLPATEKRLVLAEHLRKLNPVWADKLLLPTPEPVLPAQAADISCWTRSHWTLSEEDDGLYLLVKWHGSEDRRRLVSWSGDPPNHLEVQILPEIALQGTRQHKAKKVKRDNGDGGFETPVDVETIPIPEEHRADPTALQPFVIRWKMENDRSKCFVIGCEDEKVREKWVNNLVLYSNINKRHCGCFMWKLNNDVTTDLPEDFITNFEKAEEDLHDIRNWRRRLCFLEQLLSQKSLCITYISEKSDAEERVANTLASMDKGVVASIKALPQVTVMAMRAKDVEMVRDSIYQYDVAVSGPEDVRKDDIQLPDSLHAFEVRQADGHQGQRHSIYAFGDADTCNKWIRAIENASHKLSKGLEMRTTVHLT